MLICEQGRGIIPILDSVKSSSFPTRFANAAHSLSVLLLGSSRRSFLLAENLC
jgi:hypothetical protein